eukprot:6172536-Prorocentrum_lima.AAC.1
MGGRRARQGGGEAGAQPGEAAGRTTRLGPGRGGEHQDDWRPLLSHEPVAGEPQTHCGICHVGGRSPSWWPELPPIEPPEDGKIGAAQL